MNTNYHIIKLNDGQPERDSAECISLDVLRIEIRSAEQIMVVNPNSLLVAVFNGAHFGSASDAFPSALSGEPGFEYKSSQVRLNLAAEELRRLVLLALEPKEYFTLRQQYGLFHEIHEDFYDPDTGEAVQSKLSYL